MKYIHYFYHLFACCVLCLLLSANLCQTDHEVYGTYQLIDGFNYNDNPLPTSPPTPTPQPLLSETTTTQTTNKTAKKDFEEESKQVMIPPVIDTTPTTVSPMSVPTAQTLYNRFGRPVNYSPAMARKIGLSTLMVSGVLYGLTVLPAIIALTSGASPIAGLFSSLGRRKRSLVNESHIYRQLPLLTNEETLKFLKLFESTLAARKIESAGCKKYYTCKVFYAVLKSGEKPKLPVFENAIINVFGIAVERNDYRIQFIPTVKMYYNVAKDALKGESCARRYPCSFQAHQHNYAKHQDYRA